MGLNTFTDDYPIYEYHYKLNDTATFEIGYLFFQNMFHKFGIEYDVFKFFLTLAGIIIGIIAVGKSTSNYHIVILGYTVTSIFLDTDEVRQFVAYMCYALAFACLTDEKKGKLKYTIWILFGATIQKSAIALVLFPFLFSGLKNRTRLLRIYFTIIGLFCILILFNGNRIPFLSQLSLIFLDSSKLMYFESATRFGWLLPFSGYFMNLYIAKMGVKDALLNPEYYSERETKLIENLYDCILYTAFALPLCMINLEFERYVKFNIITCLMVVAIVYGRSIKSYQPISKNSIVLDKFNGILILYITSYEIFFQHYRVLGQVLENNVINTFSIKGF